MGPLKIEKTENGFWVEFETGVEAVFVQEHHWVGVDLDGTLSRYDGPKQLEPPYPLGQPIPEMAEMVKSLTAAGIRVKIFSARASEAKNIPLIAAWAEAHGLGRLEVTNQKDYDLIRFYDDRAIQMLPNEGRTLRGSLKEREASVV